MKHRNQLLLFFGAIVCGSVAMGIFETTFNNFLDDTFTIGADGRGALEFPRELPGLLVVLMTGALAALSVTALGMVGGLIMAGGLFGLALFGGAWTPMILVMVLASAGQHLLQPVMSSLAIGLGDGASRGRRMGFTGAFGTVGFILGSGFVWMFFDETAPPYRTGFAVAGALAVCGAVVFAFMRVPHLHQRRARFVVRKKYSLYYALEFLFGARKQIFLTFGPWALIQVYGQPASGIAAVWLIAALIGIVFKPLAGMAIDHFGERLVLIVDGVVLAVVCVGYGYARDLTGSESAALFVARACFILDNLLFALGHGRSIYVSRLTDSPQELTSTLSMGISINHIVSMTIPVAAGALWVGFGHERVFLSAAILALFISAVSSLIPTQERREPEVVL